VINCHWRSVFQKCCCSAECNVILPKSLLRHAETAMMDLSKTEQELYIFSNMQAHKEHVCLQNAYEKLHTIKSTARRAFISGLDTHSNYSKYINWARIRQSRIFKRVRVPSFIKNKANAYECHYSLRREKITIQYGKSRRSSLFFLH